MQALARILGSWADEAAALTLPSSALNSLLGHKRRHISGYGGCVENQGSFGWVDR